MMSAPGSPLLGYAYEDEPDEAWKEHRKQLIEDGFKPMIQEAKDRLERRLRALQQASGTGTPDFADFVDVDAEARAEVEEAERARLVEEFHAEAAAMKALAKEEFEHAVARERLQRRLRRDIPPSSPMLHSPRMDHALNLSPRMEQMSPSPRMEQMNLGLSPTMNQSLRLDLEHEQEETLKAAGGLDAMNEFRNLIDPSSSPVRNLIDLSSPVAPPDPPPEPEPHQDAPATDNHNHNGDNHNSIGAGALTIEITRVPTDPNGGVWVKASDAARQYELARRRALMPKPPEPQVPAEPPKKWVSASEAAKRNSSHRRIQG
ncbi:hypothetical protein DFH07DRAFT_405595 [Mycena maculata]|uniref:Uncharacterized protein n=1 Tax=Mycena maculata TaxID=230809 RepID=A0AAD7JFS6_9AGAR|nr:hypothetical protein DFH07DRAFT_405595 [Mycena maculata]